MLDVDVTRSGDRMVVRLVAGVLAGVVGVVVAVMRARGSIRVPDVVVAGTSVLAAGVVTVGLHGTRWSFNGLWGDSAFRAEAATRFTDSWALSDYAYRGLPAYYPPLLPWLEGRLGALLGQPGWAMVKPVTVVAALGVPLLAFALWQRLVPDAVAAAVVLATTVVAADLVKPDEWLVLAVLVPWWLDAVRGLVRPPRRPLPFWLHGIVVGLLLMCHTFYFAPLALATVAGVVLDRCRDRKPPLPVRRALGIGVVALVVAAPYWVPMMALRLAGAPTDNLQMRWSPDGWSWPTPVSTGGAAAVAEVVLAAAALVWLVRRVPRSRLAEALAVALAAAYVYYLGGEALQRFGVAVLAEKADALIATLLAASAVVAAADLAAAIRRTRRTAVAVVVAVGLIAVGVASVVGVVDYWALGTRAEAASETRYPDGSYPAGVPVTPLTDRHPWDVSAGDASVAQVAKAWRLQTGRPFGSGTVLVTSRADLLGTEPVHAFMTFKSHYSHPNAEFTARHKLLDEIAGCGSPRCAWRLLRHNRFDPVDGIVLSGTGRRLELRVATDDFPNAWRLTPVAFDTRQFKAPYFSLRRLPGVTVVAVTPRP